MKILKTLFILGGIILSLSSCDNGTVVETPVLLSDSDAQDIVAEALTTDNGGITLDITELNSDIDGILDLTAPLPSGSFAAGLSDFCGETIERTKSGSFSGPNVSWSYSKEWSKTLVCDENDTPEYFDVTWDASREFENQRVSSSSVVDGDWTVHLSREGGFIQKTFNGDYLKNVDRYAVQSDRYKLKQLDVNIVDVLVRRADGFILGGTLFFTMTGENQTGNTFSRSGEVVYNGDCTATITLDNGNSRTISIC